MNTNINFTPIVGLGATMYVGSDRYAMVITEVITNKKIKVSHVYDDDDKFITNKNGIQVLPENILEKYIKDNDYTIYTLRKNKRWLPIGKGLHDTCAICIGKAQTYLDPSF